MAYIDLEKYYYNISRSYFRMLESIAKFDEEHKAGLIKDKAFKKLTSNIDKVRNAYESISYFFYLWNRPTEEEQAKCDEWMKDHKDAYDYLAERNSKDTEDKISKLVDEIEQYINKVKDKTK